LTGHTSKDVVLCSKAVSQRQTANLGSLAKFMQNIMLYSANGLFIAQAQVPVGNLPLIITWRSRAFMRVRKGYWEIASYAIPDTG